MSNDELSSKNKKRIASAVAALLASSIAVPAQAQEREWKFEITPYLWAFGLDGDATVGSRTAAGPQTVKVDKKFDDFDSFDIGGSFLTVAQIGRVVIWGQADYLKLDTDELDDAPARGRLETDSFLGTLAVGYQFGGWKEGQSFDVLLGARYLRLENELQLDGIGTFKGDRDVTDPVLILRPSLRLSDRWRFNPTMSYGTGGDSEKTYELQPQFQFQINDNVAMRFGYRRLYYEIENEAGNSWDGAFQGPLIGIGGTFGSSPKPVAAMASEPPPPPPQPQPAFERPAPPPKTDGDGDGITDDLDRCPKTASGEKVDAVGCGFNVTMDVLFETNSATLAGNSHAELDRLVDAINSTPTIFAIIEGHTDSTGSSEHNQALSERRARSVADYLMSRGISADRLQWRGYGESKPIADNTTAEGRAQNRRVMLHRPDAEKLSR